jgi:hypothetical protein
MMMATTQTTAVGVFEHRRDAQQAVENLKSAGFRDDQIGLVYRDGEEGEYADVTHESYADEGAIAGAAAGAGIGGLWAVGIAAGALPAIGPVIAGGTLAAILASAAGGAVAGGLVGSLLGLGIPEEDAKYYEEEVQSGRTVVTVKSDGRYVEALEILRRAGASDKWGGDESTRVYSGQTSHREPKSIDVPVADEDVLIQRRTVTGQPASPAPRESKDIRVPVTEDKMHIQTAPAAQEEGEAKSQRRGRPRKS